MAIVFRNQIGTATLVQKRKFEGEEEKTYRYRVYIFDGNCEAVFNTSYTDQRTGKEMWHLFTFWADRGHISRMHKAHGNIFLGEDIRNIKLNLYYPTAKSVLNILTKYGYKVTCYNKQPKKSKK